MRKLFVLLLVLALLAIGWWRLAGPHPVPLKIGVLQFADSNLSTLAGFKQEMAAAGLQEGKDLDYLFPGPVADRNQLPAAVRSLLAAKPDLIFVSTTPAARAVQAVTAELAPQLPVVFAPVNDPLSAGVVKNLQQPEANLTGVRLALSEGRRLQALKDAFPHIERVFIPYTPKDKAAEASLLQLNLAAPKLGIVLQPVAFDKGSSREQIRALIPAAADAILLPRDGRVMSRTEDFASVAIERKLPLCVARFEQVQAGALIGYGFVGSEMGKQAARLARQILHGVPVANLPVETAGDYLFINLDSAKAMQVKVPDAVLRRAHFLIIDQQVTENI